MTHMANLKSQKNDLDQKNLRLKQGIGDQIIDLLQSKRYGLNISQIAEELEMSRNTVKKYVEILENEDLITVKQISASKICSIKNKTESDFREKMVFYISNYLSGFWKALDEVMIPLLEGNYNDQIIEVGKEMSKFIKWPNLADSRISKKNLSLDQIIDVALLTLKTFNEIGDVDFFNTEIVPGSKSDKTITFRVEYRGGFKLEDTESFFYLNAGFLNEKLRENFGDNVYIKVLETQPENFCCYYELGIK